MSTLKTSMHELIRACFTGIWIKTYEPFDAIAELAQLSAEEGWVLLHWDIAQGLQSAQGAISIEAIDPLAAIKSLSSVADSDSPTILVLQNFHRYVASAEVVAELAKAVHVGKSSRKFIVIIAPIVQLPAEIERLFAVLDHELPNREELHQLMDGIATEPNEMPDPQKLAITLDAAAGLTRYEAENAFSLSLVRHGCIEPDSIWELKTQALKKSGLLSLCRSQCDFSSLGGLSALKAFTKRALLRSGQPNGVSSSRKATPRGVLLLSPPGCGKSEFCKSLGKEVGRPVVVLDVGSLMGSLVGQSEERTREALRIIDSMAPCVVMIDEVEKALAGAGASGANDSGVTSRMFGTLLGWLNDHASDVFVVCTANDVAKLPPEFSRAERFDGVFFLDLPGREQKENIWNLYRDHFGIDASESNPDDENWTGAEIRSCCRLSALLDIPLQQAARNVVPVAVTSSESVQRLREWATGRCLDAENGGIFGQPAKAVTRRRVVKGWPKGKRHESS